MTDPHNVQTERTPMPTLNPKLVEALRKNNGWVRIYATSDWACVAQKKCRTIHGFSECPRVDHHESDCPCREMFMEIAHPTACNCEACLPEKELLTAMNDAHPVNCACPDCEPDDVAAKLKEHWDRFEDLYRWTCKATARMDEMNLEVTRLRGQIESTKDYVDEQIRMFVQSITSGEENLTRLQRDTKDNTQRLDALEAKLQAHESGIDEYGNPLPDTFADRLRHVERQIFQLQSERPAVKQLREAIQANRKQTLDSSTHATPEHFRDATKKVDDICKRWAFAIHTRKNEYGADVLRRLGLPEMAAVCEAADDYIEAMAGSYERLSDAVAALRKVKEAANGKA